MYTKIKTTELGIKDTFNTAFKIYTENSKFLLVLGLLIYIPLTILFVVISQGINLAMYNSDFALTLDPEWYAIITLTAIAFATLIISALVSPLVYAAIVSLVAYVIDGNEPSFKPIAEATYEKLGKHIATIILFNLVVAPMMILILPGVYFGVLFIFYPFVVALTDKWGFQAFSESRKLVKGKWFKTFGFLVLIILFSTMVSNFLGSVQGVFALFVDGNITFWIYLVIAEVINIYFKVVVALWFLNKFYLLQEEK